MSVYIVETVVTGKCYYEIQAENETEAIKIASNKYANKKIQAQDGMELTVCDDIDTFTVVDVNTSENDFLNNSDKYFDMASDGKNVTVKTQKGNIILISENEYLELVGKGEENG